MSIDREVEGRIQYRNVHSCVVMHISITKETVKR